MEHGHRKAHGPSAGRILACGADRLIFNVAGQTIVEIKFVVADLKRNRLDVPAGEQLFNHASVRVRECYQGFLDTAQVKRRFVTRHSLLQAFHIAVNVLIEEREEKAKVFRIALVRRRRHQEVVIRHLRKRLAKLVRQGFFVGAISAHLVRLIDDDEIPMAAKQRLLGVFDAGHPGHRSNELVLILPRVAAVIGAQHIATDNFEVLAKLVFELPLPLKR